ncbi:hypothetical protein EC12741_B0087 [Escherichia coli 1.2741]|nr:hypothetical protein EC12741_B0087 [Escherichia coli 1.2741]
MIRHRFPFLSVSPFHSFSLNLNHDVKDVFILHLCITYNLHNVFVSMISSVLKLCVQCTCNLSCFYVVFVFSERPFFHYN